MSYYDYDYDYDFDDRDIDITPDAVRETYNDIEALTRGYDDRHIYTRSVNRVFYDIFGIDKIGSAFASRSRDRRADAFRISVFKRIGVKVLVNMIGDPDTYEDIQDLVKLHYDVTHSNMKRDKIEEASAIYQETIERIKKIYGIRTKSSVSSRSNPLKSLRRKNRDFDDDRDRDRRYGIYDDDDFGFYDYDRRRRRRRYDDDYDDDDDFINAILKGVEPLDYSRGRSKKKKKASSSRREDFDDDDSDFEAKTAENIDKIATLLTDMNERIGALESASHDEDYYEPEDFVPTRRPKVPLRDREEPDVDTVSVTSSIDALSRSINSLAKNQAKDREDLNGVIDIIRASLEDADDEIVEDELPPNVLGGDLLKTQGGINNST